MTRVRLTRAGDGRFALLVQGHAGYAPKGADIVCAGVSTLNWAAANLLRAAGATCAVRADEGSFLLLARGAPAARLLPALLDGYRQIAARYPAFVRVENDARPHI